uniref:Cytochrome b5 heme-binding domain-containing protein n=1 Tax=Pseudo-nitzschia australis TaxID=44445 RepID=A0A7S4AVA8_9STRA
MCHQLHVRYVSTMRRSFMLILVPVQVLLSLLSPIPATGLTTSSSTRPRIAHKLESPPRAHIPPPPTKTSNKSTSTTNRNRNTNHTIIVFVDDHWYNLSEFRHPGGDEFLRRHNGQDITNLFYSNHWHPETIKGRVLVPTELNDDVAEALLPTTTTKRCPFSQPDPHSPLYKELKRKVKLYMDENEIPWRYQPTYRVFAVRAACLALCVIGRELDWDKMVCVTSALSYGFFTGRMVWTHVHNCVHNPSSISTPMRWWLEFDCVAVVSLWMHEHLTHHAETNTDSDPDVHYFSPLFDYLQIARDGGSSVKLCLAICSYPLLVPFMLTKSILHAVNNDPVVAQTGTSIWLAVLVGPLRFGLDILALGNDFVLALMTATAYIVLTFAATHQLEANHGTSSGDWMLDQIRSTNSVWSRSKLYSAFTGGISNHVEHHIFPQISNDVLVEIAPVVQEFAEENGVEYNSLSPWELMSRHSAFVGGGKSGIEVNKGEMNK